MFSFDREIGEREKPEKRHTAAQFGKYSELNVSQNRTRDVKQLEKKIVDKLDDAVETLFAIQYLQNGLPSPVEKTTHIVG